MQNCRNRIIAVLVALLWMLLSAPAVQAQPVDHAVPRWTVDAGGSRSRGGQYTLVGIAGQPDVGIAHSDKYTLSGGFWSGAVLPQRIYLPVVQR